MDITKLALMGGGAFLIYKYLEGRTEDTGDTGNGVDSGNGSTVVIPDGNGNGGTTIVETETDNPKGGYTPPDNTPVVVSLPPMEASLDLQWEQHKGEDDFLKEFLSKAAGGSLTYAAVVEGKGILNSVHGWNWYRALVFPNEVPYDLGLGAEGNISISRYLGARKSQGMSGGVGRARQGMRYYSASRLVG